MGIYLLNRYNKMIQNEQELREVWKSDLEYDEITENEYSFEKWIQDLVDTGDYELIKK